MNELKGVFVWEFAQYTCLYKLTKTPVMILNLKYKGELFLNSCGFFFIFIDIIFLI